MERLLTPNSDPIINPNCLQVGPDLLVRKANDRQGNFLGDNVRISAPDVRQRIVGVSIDGRKVSYEMRLQNDLPEPARFRLQASKLDTLGINGLTQEFFLVDGVNETSITDAMANGFETSAAIQSGAFLTIRAEVALNGVIVSGTKVLSVVKAFNATGDTNAIKDLLELETTFGLVVNTTDDRRDFNLLNNDALDVAPEIPGDQVSLRAAIDVINANLGNGEIRFDIPTDGNAVPKISVIQSNGGGLVVTRPLAAILGQSQPGSKMVEIDLSGITEGDPFVIDANLVKVQGLFLTGSKRHGLVVKKPGNQIGGASPEEGNVISGNEFAGVSLESSLNVLRNNRIGTNPEGSAKNPNGAGVIDTAGGNFIGLEGVGNLISGNLAAGVQLLTPLATTVSSNRIGTDARGLASLGNEFGIEAAQGKGPVISGNLISGNRDAGIRVDSTADNGEVADTLIIDNVIGKSIDSKIALPNEAGIKLLGRGATNTRIGDRDESTGISSNGNVISGNTFVGIIVDGARRTGIFKNSLVDNNDAILLFNASDTLIQANVIAGQIESGGDQTGIEVGEGVEGLVIGGVSNPVLAAPSLPLGEGNTFSAHMDGIIVAGDLASTTESVRMPTILSNKFLMSGESIRVGNVLDRPNAPQLTKVVKASDSLLILGSVFTPASVNKANVLLQFFAHDPMLGGLGPSALRLLGQRILREVEPNRLRVFEAPVSAILNENEQVVAIATIVEPDSTRSSSFSNPRAAELGVDSDGDGVLDELEGTLDGNSDGIPDANQSHVVSFQPNPESSDPRAIALVTKPTTPFVAAGRFSSTDLELPPRVRPISDIVDFTLRTDTDNSAEVRATFPRGTANRYLKLTRDPETGQLKVKRLQDGSIDFFDFERASRTGTIIDLDTDPASVAFTLLFSDGLRGDEVKTGEFDGLVVDPGIFVAVPETDVELKLAAPPRANVGETVVFTFEVANKGTELADNLLIDIVLPADVEFIGGGVFDPVTRRVLIDAGDVVGGASTQRSLIVKPAGRQEFLLTADLHIGGVALDTNTTDNQATSNLVSVVDPPPPPPPPSVITARKQGRRLVITGSENPDQLRITLSGTSILVTPLGGSEINGRTSAVEFVGVGTIDISLLGGNDIVELVGAGFRGQITLRGGPGDDIFRPGARGARTRVIDTEGRNRVGFSLAGQGVRLDLLSSEAQRIDNTGNVLELRGQFPDVTGSPFRDFLRGRRGWHKILTGGGSDRIVYTP